MLGGLARCAGCGHTLKITGNTERKSGERYPVYYCVGRYAKGPCSARANVRASILDHYVEEQVLTALQAEDGLLAQAVAASEHIEAAARAVSEAEHELDLSVNNPKLLSVVGEKKFVEGAEVRQRALDEARAALADARAQSALVDELGDGDRVTAWPTLTTQERRRLIHGLLERVAVTRADRRGRHAHPIIILRGGVVLESSAGGRLTASPLD